MCGIAGAIDKKGKGGGAAAIQEMIDAVRHRGPDGEGTYHDVSVAFGHCRLSIQDLSAEAKQPMQSPDGDVVLIYNGEIYNFIELRGELQRLGHVFHSTSDTEVVLESYREWGGECVKRFNGMWAFAIYDRQERSVFCSRDRFGIKPFYYLDTDDEFAFGSELKQLLPLLKSRKANESLLLNFILTSITDDSNETFFNGISKLPAGHNLVYYLEQHSYDLYPYYELSCNEDVLDMSPVDAVEAFGALFFDSIRLRMRADVQVGTCLSGGMDSSSVAAVAAGINREGGGRPFSAITAVSTQSSNDESEFARQVAERAGINWIGVKPTYDDFAGALGYVVRAQEEPFAGPSLIMQHFVMKAAHENGIKVLLDGQGGDELLLGYEKYYTAYLVAKARSGGATAVLAAIRDILRNNDNMRLARLAMYSVAGLSAIARQGFYLRRHAYLAKRPVRSRYLDEYASACRNVFKMQKLEITKSSLPVLLRYEDKNSMAHSVEARLPFLDYRLVEMAVSLSESVKIHEGWTKWVLRESMKQVLPRSVAWRRDKKGFEAPEAQWLERHRREMHDTVMASPLLSRYCDRKRLRKAYDSLDRRSRWRLYSIALWEQEFDVAT